MTAATMVLGLVLLVAGALLVPTLEREFRRRHQQIAAAQLAHRRAHHEAAHDPLTGLPNRRQLERELARRLDDAALPDGMPVAVHLVDVDDLKRINDGHGHAAGDHVLKAVGQALEGAVRRGDFVARIGGDEFVVLQHDADAGRAGLMAKRLTDLVGRPLRLADGTVLVPSASIGSSLFAVDGMTGEALLEVADRRLYAAKRAARTSGWRPVREVAVSAT